MEDIPIQGDDPQRRFGHTVTLIDDTKAILFGGAILTADGFDITNDTFLFSYETLSWRRIRPEQEASGPNARAAHGAAVVEKRQLVIFGGAIGRTNIYQQDGEMADDDLYLLRIKDPNVDQGKWLKVPIEGRV
jgi:protein phosphatase